MNPFKLAGRAAQRMWADTAVDPLTVYLWEKYLNEVRDDGKDWLMYGEALMEMGYSPYSVTCADPDCGCAHCKPPEGKLLVEVKIMCRLPEEDGGGYEPSTERLYKLHWPYGK